MARFECCLMLAIQDSEELKETIGPLIDAAEKDKSDTVKLKSMKEKFRDCKQQIEKLKDKIKITKDSTNCIFNKNIGGSYFSNIDKYLELILNGFNVDFENIQIDQAKGFLNLLNNFSEQGENTLQNLIDHRGHVELLSSQPFSERVKWLTPRRLIALMSTILYLIGCIVASFEWNLAPPGFVARINAPFLAGSMFLGAAILFALWFYSAFTWRRTQSYYHHIDGSGTRSTLNYLVFGGLAFCVILLLAAGVMNANSKGGLSQVTTTEGARAVITILIAIGTIAIAIILTLASVVMDGPKEDQEIIKERLSKGKDIFTILVGVLGTIVGFYYAKDGDAAVNQNGEVVNSQSNGNQAQSSDHSNDSETTSD